MAELEPIIIKLMAELEPKAALKTFNPASVMFERSVFVSQQSIRDTHRQKPESVTHRQHLFLIHQQLFVMHMHPTHTHARTRTHTHANT